MGGILDWLFTSKTGMSFEQLSMVGCFHSLQNSRNDLPSAFNDECKLMNVLLQKKPMRQHDALRLVEHMENLRKIILPVRYKSAANEHAWSSLRQLIISFVVFAKNDEEPKQNMPLRKGLIELAKRFDSTTEIPKDIKEKL